MIFAQKVSNRKGTGLYSGNGKGGTRMRAKIAALVAAVVLGVGVGAQGAVVYSQQADFTQASFYSGPDYPRYIADDFKLSATTAVTDVQWWGLYSGATPAVDSFVIMLYSDISGSSPTPVATYDAGGANRTAIGVSPLPGAVELYTYTYTLPAAFNATGGVFYYVSIYDNASGSFWAWSQSKIATPPGDSLAWARTGGAFTTYTGHDMTFELASLGPGDSGIEAVPEPMSVTLFVGSVIAGWGMMRRRLRRGAVE